MVLPDSPPLLPKRGTDKPIDFNVTVCFVRFTSSKLSEMQGAMK